MADLSKMLAKAKKSWSDSVDKAGSVGITFSDGKYVFQWVGTEAKEASTGTFGISNQWLVLEGEKEGDTYYQWINLFNADDEISSFTIQFLKLVTNQDPSDLDISELEIILEDALKEDQVYAAILKTTTSKKDGREYQNLRLGRRLEDFHAAEEVAPAKVEQAASVSKAKPPVKPAKVVEPEPEEEEEEEEEKVSPFDKGDEVTFTVTSGKGSTAKVKEFSGTILSVDDDEETAEVKTGGTDRKPVFETVAFKNITLAVEDADEEDAEDADEEDEEEVSDSEYSVGDEVTFEQDGTEYTGTVKEIDDDSEELEVEVQQGKKKKTMTITFADVVSEDEILVGSLVAFTDPKDALKEVNGRVVSLDDNAEIASVKVGAKTIKVGYADLILLIEEAETE